MSLLIKTDGYGNFFKFTYSFNPYAISMTKIFPPKKIHVVTERISDFF